MNMMGEKTECQKLIIAKLVFEIPYHGICGKNSLGIFPLARIAPYMILSKRCNLMNFFQILK